MKRHGNLWARVVAWDNLREAARKARRGKSERSSVQQFNYFEEYELMRLQTELENGTYRPGAFRSHWIIHPKRRMISAAPYRDRVLHHALMNVLEPILDAHFHPYCFACRKGKGTHAAADRTQEMLRTCAFSLQCDVKKFFPSIDHEILTAIFRTKIKDARVLGLMDSIVDCSNEQEPVVEWFEGDEIWTPYERKRGLPIGNLTSQWFANWYLSAFDHAVAALPGIKGYARYCDDFNLFGDCPADLWRAAEWVVERLARLRLKIHGNKISVRPSREGVSFVGYRIWPSHRVLRKSNVLDFRRRMRWMKRKFATREISLGDFKARLTSWLGHAKQADSNCLVRRLSADWRL